jgi:YqaJ-like viral recombinase domain
MIIHNHEQGSGDWYRARMGIPTASNFNKIVTPTGKLSLSANEYIYSMIAELVLNEPQESLQGIYYMDRGRELEDDARRLYCFENEELKVEQVGFITTDDGEIGCSPDSLVGDDGLLEIKCPAPTTHVSYWFEKFDDIYKPQVQGQLMVTGRNWCDWFSYHPKMPSVPVRIFRDEKYIALLQDALGGFVKRKKELLAEAESRGLYVRAEKVISPVEADYIERAGGQPNDGF